MEVITSRITIATSPAPPPAQIAMNAVWDKAELFNHSSNVERVPIVVTATVVDPSVPGSPVLPLSLSPLPLPPPSPPMYFRVV